MVVALSAGMMLAVTGAGASGDVGATDTEGKTVAVAQTPPTAYTPTPGERTVTVMSTALVSRSVGAEKTYAGSGCSTFTSTTAVYAARVDLPQGAHVTGITVSGYDISNTGQFSAYLTEYSEIDSPFMNVNELAFVASGGSFAGGSFTADAPAGALVNNEVGAYMINVTAATDTSFCWMQIHFAPAQHEFVAIAPCVIYDSRPSKGGEGSFGAKQRRSIRAVRFSYASVGGDSSSCGIPAGAHAVEVNVAVLSPGASGGLRIYPHGAAQPGADSILFDAGSSVANSMPVKLGTNDRFYVRNSSDGSTTVQLTVLGYYS